jgi:hypothetical protein
MDDRDDLDDQAAELEARFRELEQEAELEKLRSHTGASPTPRPSDARPGQGLAEEPVPDPLADLKSALDGGEPVARFLLALCPHCGAKNRVSLARVRTGSPICGRCKKDLAAIRAQ